MERIVFVPRKIASRNRVFCKGGLFPGNRKTVPGSTDCVKPGRSPRSHRPGAFFGPRGGYGGRAPTARGPGPGTGGRAPGTAHQGARATAGGHQGARAGGQGSATRWPGSGATAQGPGAPGRAPGSTPPGTRTTGHGPRTRWPRATAQGPRRAIHRPRITGPPGRPGGLVCPGTIGRGFPIGFHYIRAPACDTGHKKARHQGGLGSAGGGQVGISSGPGRPG